MQVETIRCADRADWLEARRRNGIGGSDAAAILGVSRFKGPLALYHEKLGTAPMPDEEREELYWGKALEPAIAQRYANETRRKLIDPGEFTIQKRGFMLATLDREIPEQETDAQVVIPPGVLEIKTAHWSLASRWEDADVPEEYLVQVQHQLAVTGRTLGSIAVLIGGSTFKIRDIPRDNEFIDLLMEQERAFWNQLTARTPPAPDASNATRELLKRLYPKDTGARVALPDEALIWAADLAAAKKLEKDARELISLNENRLKAAIGDATYGDLPDRSCFTWKWQRREAFSVDASEFRVLRFSGGKGKRA